MGDLVDPIALAECLRRWIVRTLDPRVAEYACRVCMKQLVMTPEKELRGS